MEQNHILVESLNEELFFAKADNILHLVFVINEKEYLITRINDKITPNLAYEVFKKGSLWIANSLHSRKIDFFEIEPLVNRLLEL